MNEKLAQAMDHISDEHITEAAAPKVSRRRIFFRAAAAVLVLALLLNLPGLPMVIQARTVASASESRQEERPDKKDYQDNAEYWAAFDAWVDNRDRRTAQAQAAMETLAPFFKDTTTGYLSDAGSTNRVWSPVNAYIALAMLAEVTGGESRSQILSALNTEDLDVLRAQVEAVWEEVYQDGNEICLLANSLWLDKNLDYNQETMDNVAYYHYADIYRTDLSSAKAGKALRAWLNNNTGGLLKDYTRSSGFPPEAVLTLASTVYLQAKWSDEFNPTNNTQETFHSPGGDITATFMNAKLRQMNYYWGNSFGAVALGLKNGTRMWFFLPDEDKTVDDVLAEGQYWDLLSGSSVEGENTKYMKVNLSIPKFDVSSGGDISPMLKAMGITDIFSLETSDFTAITSDTPVFVTSVNQAARVIVDEQGVKAASYIEIPGAGAAAPPEEIIDFILDRPFLFVIADYSGIPLFTGVVNVP